MKINDKVICVSTNTVTSKRNNKIIKPKIGKIYSIRTIEFFDYGIYIRLNEIINSEYFYIEGKSEIQFNWECFMPLTPMEFE